MSSESSLPSYDRLFGDLDLRDVDDARSVYSPAAYLADLLELLHDQFESPALVERRPAIESVPLDAESTYTVVPYLDIVNEQLAAALGTADAFETLRTLSYPAALPFALRDERLKTVLNHLGVGAAELYALFTPSPAPDMVARLRLGLSAEDVGELVAASVDSVGGDDIDDFRRANGLSSVELRTVLATTFVGQGTSTSPPGPDVRDRVIRFVRLARRVNLPFPELDLVLSSCCENRINQAALRTVAALIAVGRASGLPIDVVCSLAAPMDPTGLDGTGASSSLFDRVFNGPYLAAGPALVPAAPAGGADGGRPVLACAGDVLAPRNNQYRQRVARALGLSEDDLTTVVQRFRARDAGWAPSDRPFDRADGYLADLSLLHRVSRLVTALDTSVTELFCVLDVLDADPAFPGDLSFAVPVAHEAKVDDCYRMLDAPDVGSSLCLVQALFAVMAWMRAQGLTGQELAQIVGAAASDGEDGAEQIAVLQNLADAFDDVALAPEIFQSDRFGERAAEVVHDILVDHGDGVVSARDPRLLQVDPVAAELAAYTALVELGAVAEQDFLGLGLGERLAAKIFTNLVHRGVLAPDGTLDEQMLPPGAAELVLATDFSPYRDAVVARVLELQVGDVATAIYPSDLADLGPTDSEAAELYDNLVFQGYLDPDGQVLRSDVFAEAEDPDVFVIDVDLDHVAAPVLALLRARVEEFRAAPLTLDPEIFAPLALGDRLGDLLDSLRFNGYIDARGALTDKTTLAAIDLIDLNLALEFYPHRRRVLDAVQGWIAAARQQGYTFTPDDFAELADQAVAAQVVAQLDGSVIIARRIAEDLQGSFLSPAEPPDLGITFPPDDQTVIGERIATIVREQQPYRLDPTALADLGFDETERADLVALLVAKGDLTEELTVPQDRLAFFGTVHHAVGYSLPGLEDYAKDVFFLLHSVATELAAGISEITATLAGQADRQAAALFAVLQDALAVPAATVEAMCAASVGSRAQALELFVAPVLAAADPETGEVTTPPTDPHFRTAYRRLRRFAPLVAKLALDPIEVSVAFADQDLVGKFPEPLELPPGVDRIDALLESRDGHVYLFAEGGYWTYSSATYALADPQPRPLTELSGRLGPLAEVDAAFTDTAGTEWIVGRRADGTGMAFVRPAGSTRWIPRAQVWGTVRNTLAAGDSARVDAAYVDADGRTYLFCQDQYVRYSGSDYSLVDEGYPRSIAEWWTGEGRQTPLPPRFLGRLDAAFEGRDGRLHLFAGDRCLSVADGPTGSVLEAPVAEVWGRVRNTFGGAQRVDAAYAVGAAASLFAGNQVARYSDCIENDGVRIDEGFPRRIESHLPDVPTEFEGGVEAAFVDSAGTVHLFKDAKAASLARGAGSVAPTAERWGVLGPVLLSGTVDAAFVGLDGKTYLFSGDRYLRYSGADYTVVDVGYPRRIAGDWGGLRHVQASFVLDGVTYLFGTGGDLLTLPIEYAADLDAGRISSALRQRLARQGLTLPADTGVAGQRPWRITADHGIRLVFTPRATDIMVTCDDNVDTPFYVRYSTRDYTRPDADHPRPLTDDWWSLPAGPAAGSPAIGTVDAVFTGRDNRTYLFSGNRFVVFDHRRRWWSAPQDLQSGWDSLPFERVDAAFVGTDGKTYIFSGPQYARYSSGDYTKVDDRYPAPISTFWGRVTNAIGRTGRVDATLVIDEHTYLFSGDQYVRYTGNDYAQVDDGYPRSLDMLGREPRFGNLGGVLDGQVDAAFADRHNVYLFSGRRWHVISDTLYRTYELPATAGCAFVEDGSLLVEEPAGWRHYSAIEGATLARTPVRPRTLRTVPAEFRTGLDAVLQGADGNTYLFKGPLCYDAAVGRAYPLAEEWGRPHNTIDQDNAVDAAFVGVDGRTYLFRGDQFVVYDGPVTTDISGGPRPVTEWGGLTSVALAYVQDGRTYLFEKPAADGMLRHVVYSGADYTTCDPDYPVETDAGFWEVPDDRWPADFPAPDAVLFEGDTTLLVCGDQYLQRTGTTGAWSHPRPLTRIWRDIGPGAVRAAFTDRDGATHFFFDGEFTTYRNQVCAPRQPIRRVWARSRNNFFGTAGSGRVDAAFVHRGTTTFLFSGDQYARYSGPDYRFTDPGYPRPLAGNLRQEAPFTAMPEAFEDVIADRVAAGGRVMDAVVANPRTVYIFVDRTCHVASQTASATYDIATLGHVRNTIVDRRRVDAALVTDAHTFLFSGDQYVRYSGAALDVVDDGYPRTLESSLAADLDLPTELPEQFRDGLDAAFRGTDGKTYLFAATQFLRAGAPPQAIGGTWGRVHNAFATGGGTAIDAAFVAPTGALHAFRGGQYIRYRPGSTEIVEEGYPRSIRDDWGDLPADFEDVIDGAFVFEGRTYFCCGGSYVRYSAGYHAVDRTYPQPFRTRWSHAGDYRLADIHTIARFAELAHAHPAVDGGLAVFLAAGPAAVPDPFAHLAGLLGWNADEIRWLQRRGGFLPQTDDDRLDLELILRLRDLFALADRLGSRPSRIHDEVWQRLFGPSADLAGMDAAAATLQELLAQLNGPDEWRALSDRIHDELNVGVRDALVAAVLAKDPADGLRTSRDLFDRFLIDVEMGPEGRTSRVREAIAATQMYLHRYLLNLEPATTRGPTDVVRARIRTWWGWMRTYRVWEANRKVFLYPENYLRPELRAAKTPAFRALESDLLQGEITPASVQGVYKRYLDEYTEVSRLTIAGGYVYAEQGRDPAERSLVLFGRTKTDPRRYYYRRAIFRSGDTLSSTWEPWLEVGVAIDADTVHPTHAFDRVFVFWATVEAVRPDPTAGTVVTTDAEGAHHAVPTQARHRVKIFYSFYNLSGEWVPAQELGASGPQNGTLTEVTLSVRAPEPQPGRPTEDKGSIEVSCRWTVTAPVTDTAAEAQRSRDGFALYLYSALYAIAGPAPTTEEASPDMGGAVRAIFGDAEQIGPGQVVRFSNPTASPETHWFSVDHKGGSFLCRPAVDYTALTPQLPLTGNRDRLPEWSRIDAAFELDDGCYFFDNTAGTYVLIPSDGRKPAAPRPITERWGRWPRPTPEGLFDAVLVRGDQTFVFTGGQYSRYPTGRFDHPDPGYPRDLAGNPDDLPSWGGIDAAFRAPDGTENFPTRRGRGRGGMIAWAAKPGDLPSWGGIDAAFRAPDGTEYFFTHRGRSGMIARGAKEEPQPLPEAWGLKAPVDAAFVDTSDNRTFLFAGNQYVRFSSAGYESVDAGYPKMIANNTDGLPNTTAVNAAFMTGTTLLLLGADRSWLVSGRGGSPMPVGPDGTRTGYNAVETAWVRDDFLYLVLGRTGGRLSARSTARDVRRYPLDGDGIPAEFMDEDYATAVSQPPDAAFGRDGDLYLLSRASYARLPAGQVPDASMRFMPVGKAWADLPADVAAQVTGSLDTVADLYLFLPGHYLKYPKDVAVPRPFELAMMPRDIVRLTSGTAATLNQLLLAGGVAALLTPQAQEIDETPRFRTDLDTDTPATDTTVTVRWQKVAPERLPTSSHLDFESANGLYYWEIFFHAPLLIAQALNEAQRFDEARRWYEYIFDPTSPTAYWQFLPFLAVDVDALITRLRELRSEADALWPGNRTLGRLLNPVLDDLTTVAPSFRTHRELTEAERQALDRLASTVVSSALAGHERKAEKPLAAALHRLQEITGVITGLSRQYFRMGDHARLLEAYRADPFDPHAIAELRPVAYRRAVVMAYVDNLLDWGDMLFRQHTAESIDEARMLYVLAMDLLGGRPEQLGTQLPPAGQSFANLDKADPGELDLLTDFLTGGGALTDGPGAVHSSVASSYFHIPANSTFEGYLERVEDRLRKIRQSLDILGIAQPVPLFEPPIDAMSMVRAAAGGVGPGVVQPGVSTPVPHYRFTTVFRKAQEMVDKLRQSGSDLLSVLERRDAEELGLLQSRQEGVILGLTRGIKEAEVRMAAERMEELRAARTGTADRVAYFTKAIADGPSSLQKEQMAMMTRGRDAHFASAGLKIAAAIAKAAPQVKVGPFILGIEIGGDEVGGALETAAEVSEAFGEAFSMAGELLGVQAEVERAAEDWTQQLAAARSDLAQIEHQFAGAEQQLAVAERELEIAGREIAHQEAVATFLQNKFGNAELYRWLAGRLAGLYFEAYHLAYELARSAEQALRFERGVPDSEVSVIRPSYWESRRSGLLAAEGLSLDLERLGKAWFDGDARGLEISKRVSLRELDPVAFVRFKNTGSCEFALTEALFDRDFPGHYRRQIRTLTVTFVDGDGESIAVNATLTQLGHKTVLAADPKAVKFLLAPQGLPPETVRADWRPNQRIVLSYVDDRSENNGLHELRFDDERYLPFEGTGVVSTWALRLAGGVTALADVQDVAVVVRYTAEDGGEVFAAAVRGMLKPYVAARFFDVAVEFPQEWEDFQNSDEAELLLPFTADMFPGIAGRDITGIYPSYDLADGDAAQLVLDGERPITLDAGRLLPNPGLRVGGNGSSGWTFTIEGEKEALRNVGLVLTYKAG